MSYSAEKCKRGTLWDLLTYIQSQNIKKLEGDPLGSLKNFRQKSHSAEKIHLGDPLGTSGFVGFLEKVKKGGRFTLCRLRLKSKKQKGGLLGDRKTFSEKEKSRTVRKKIERGTL